jgi:hypothetical protein
MNSATWKVCENLKVFGFLGFIEKSSAFRFAQQRKDYHEQISEIYWIEHGRRLPSPTTRSVGASSKSSSSTPTKKRSQVKISNTQLKKLLAMEVGE